MQYAVDAKGPLPERRFICLYFLLAFPFKLCYYIKIKNTLSIPEIYITNANLSSQVKMETIKNPFVVFRPSGIKINMETGKVSIPEGLSLDETSMEFWKGLERAFQCRIGEKNVGK